MQGRHESRKGILTREVRGELPGKQLPELACRDPSTALPLRCCGNSAQDNNPEL